MSADHERREAPRPYSAAVFVIPGLIASIATAVPSRLTAQAGACESAWTVARCKAAAVPQQTMAGNAVTVQVIRSAAKEMGKQLTNQRSTGGDSPAAAPGSSLDNYLPLFAAAVMAPGLSADTAALGLNLNLPFNDGQVFDLGFTAQLSVVAHRPKVLNQIVDSVASSMREPVRKLLEGAIDDLDDTEIGLTFSADNHTFGRRFGNYDDDINRISNALTSGSAARLERASYIRDSLQSHLVDSVKRKTDKQCMQIRADLLPVHCTDSVALRGYIDALIEVDWAMSALSADSKAEFQNTGFDRITDLINNQPQLSAGFAYRNRRDIVGPSEFTAEAKLELGFANLNVLRRRCHGVTNAACVQGYLTNRRVLSSLAREDRVAFSVSYVSQPSYHVSRKDTFDLALPKARKLTSALSYGRYVAKRDDGTDKGHLDAQLQYAWQLKDSHRQNQVVGSLMLTEPLSDQTSMLIGITWANKAEFLGAQDKPIRANVGLTYHLASRSN